MALNADVAIKLIKSILTNATSMSAALAQIKDAGVSTGEIVNLALDHAPLKTRYDEIGAAVNAAEGTWPLPLPLSPKAAAPTTPTPVSGGSTTTPPAQPKV